MTSNSDLGTLNYTNSNPHQLSSYGTRTFLYDNAGNMTRNGGINKFSWDYRNRLSTSNDIASNNNTYYQYDHNNQRFLKYTEDYVFIPPIPQEELMMQASRVELDGGEEQMSGGSGHWEWQVISQDKYVDKYFEENLGEQTKSHVFLNDIKLATINNDNNPYFIISDHLNSSSILTNSTGTIAEITDYKPYGTTSYTNTAQDLKDDYTFTGQEYDEENNLQYYGARYLDNQIAKFTSLEPVMLVLYDGKKVKSIAGQELQKILSDPQALNSYAYSRNNPIILVDVDGNWWKELLTGKQSWSSFQVELGQAAEQLYNDSGTARAAMDHPVAAGVVIGVAGGAAAAGASAGLTALSVQYLGGAGTACIMGCQKAADVVNETAPKLLNPSINISTSRLNHVIDEHTVGGANTIGNSVFNQGENITNLIKQGTQQVIEKQSFGYNFQRVFDVGRNIGIDRLTNQQTRIMTIITDKSGNLITAFPGKP
jgi:RHS repeat-associated protein